MVTAKLYGGLGNQMFQIAAAEALAKRNNDVAVFDLDACHTGLQGNPASHYKHSLFSKLTNQNSYFATIQNYYKEPRFSYDKIPYMKNMMIDGYFQSPKYFEDQEEHICNIFTFPDEVVKDVETFLINLKNKSVTSLHIRRGDYLKFPNVHPICTIEYYQTSIELLPNNNFVIISDDITWAMNNLKADNIFYSNNKSELFDLCLMTHCDNNITANSSFSWWGAWLNKNEDKKIIQPKLWFVDRPCEVYRDIYQNKSILI